MQQTETAQKTKRDRDTPPIKSAPPLPPKKKVEADAPKKPNKQINKKEIV